MIRFTTLLRGALASINCLAAAPLSAQTLSPNTLFGLRFGVPLEAQISECPKGQGGG